MVDLPKTQSAQAVKIVSANVSGVDTGYLDRYGDGVSGGLFVSIPLNAGAVDEIIEVGTTPIEVIVETAPKEKRQMIYLQPRTSKLYISSKSNVDGTLGPNGGMMLFKNQILAIGAGENTRFYIVAESNGQKVYFGEL